MSHLATLIRCAAAEMSAALVFICTASPAALANEVPHELFDSMMNGQPPSLQGERFEQARLNLKMELSAIAQSWRDPGLVDGGHHCRKFAENVRTVLRALYEVTDTLQGAGRSPPEAHARFLLLVPAISTLSNLLARGADGGFGTLSTTDKSACTYRDKDVLNQQFLKFATNLYHFSLNALGSPGIRGFEQLTDKLLAKADTEAKSRSRMGLALIGATTLTSVAFWTTAPQVSMGLWRFFGASDLTLGSWTLYGIRSSALASETLFYRYVEDKINPQLDSRQEFKGSWQDLMHDIDLISHASEMPSETLFVLLTQVEIQYLDAFRHWLRDAVAALPQTNETNLALGIIKETLATAGLDVPNSAQKIIQQLRTDYGIETSCDSSYFSSGLYPANCLRSLRAFARAVYGGDLALMPTLINSTLRVEFCNDENPRIQSDAWTATVHLPWLKHPRESLDFLLAAGLSDQVRKMASLAAKMEDLKKNLEINLGSEITISPSLSVLETYHDLIQLEYLAKNRPDLLPADVEVFALGRTANAVRESALKITLDLNATGTLREWSNWLDGDRDKISIAILRIQEDRRHLAAVEAGFLKTQVQPVEYQVRCYPSEAMSSAICAKTMAHFLEYTRDRIDFSPSTQRVVFVARDQTQEKVESSSNTGNMIVLREDFSSTAIDELALTRGWFK